MPPAQPPLPDLRDVAPRRPRRGAMPVLSVLAPLLLLLLFFLLPPPRGSGVSIAGIPSLCFFHNVTGLPCPGCGITRALVCCAHGQWSAAFTFHPLGPPVFLTLVGFTLLRLWGAFRPT